jgi:glucose/arabinose dehydrogenase
LQIYSFLFDCKQQYLYFQLKFKTMKNSISILLLFLSFTTINCAENKSGEVDYSKSDYSHEVVVSDVAIPWGIAFLPDGSMLVTEKGGELIHSKNGADTKIKGLPEITVLGQGGLMDVAVHPNYESNDWLYISYASADGTGEGANTTIMRFKIENNTMIDKEVLYKAEPNSKKGQHFGSRIAFDNEGFLFFTVGDRGNRELNPQNINRDCGKVYRLHDDGKTPVDNPFIRDKDAKKAIYSFGHRNPQGMERHPVTGDIWTHEHGPRGGDEINIIEKGKNYGWPKISFGINYSGTKFTDHTALPGMEQPAHQWTPSIAPSGMAFVTGDIYPELKGNLLVGSLKFQYVSNCVLDGNKVVKEEKLLDGIGRVRSIEQGPDGYIYVGVENVGVVKLIPKK